MDIPVKFYNLEKAKVDQHPIAMNVGELIDILTELPTDLPIENGFEKGCMAVVYNISTGAPFLELTEVE